MSDTHDQMGPPAGGPSWMRRGGAPAVPAVPEPEVLPTPDLDGATPSGAAAPGWSGAAALPTALPGVVNTGTIDGEAERDRPPKLSFSRHAITPLPYAGAALASIVALLVALSWATDGTPAADAPDSLRTLNQVWLVVTNLLLVQEDVQLLVGVQEATVMLVLAGIVVAAMALWIGRIGRNLPLGDASFGMGLALLGLPAWWTFSLTAGALDDFDRSRIDAMMRIAVAAGVLVVQFVLLRWALLNKVWRAGRIPGDLGALVLWVPEIVPWSLYLGSSLYTLAATDEGEPPSTTWQPTEAMVDWGIALSRISLVAIIVLLLVVSVRQHLGIAADRRTDAAAREAARLRRAVPEGAQR